MLSHSLLLIQLGAINAQHPHERCGKTESCMMLPDNCMPELPSANFTPCNHVEWRTEKNGVHLTLHAQDTDNAGDWAAVGFNAAVGDMRNSDIYICKRLGDEVRFVSAFATKNGPPTEYPTVNGVAPGVVNGSIHTEHFKTNHGKVFMCKFVMDHTVVKEKMTFNYTQGSKYHVLEARGILTNWTTTYHKDRMASKDPVEFFHGEKHQIIHGNGTRMESEPMVSDDIHMVDTWMPKWLANIVSKLHF